MCNEITNYIVGVEQLTTTTLRATLEWRDAWEQTLTSGDRLAKCVLDEATRRRGLRVAVEPRYRSAAVDSGVDEVP